MLARSLEESSAVIVKDDCYRDDIPSFRKLNLADVFQAVGFIEPTSDTTILLDAQGISPTITAESLVSSGPKQLTRGM
jgi:hypothetical protein